jgi:ABC-type Fe3+ transport system permease subunit
MRFWPCNLSLTWANYNFESEGVGWQNFSNSLVVSLWVATVGAAVIFTGSLSGGEAAL